MVVISKLPKKSNTLRQQNRDTFLKMPLNNLSKIAI